ncbi:PLP-dependent aminotransferase family protein [Candidatus Zixiibacteriota bacterium]
MVNTRYQLSDGISNLKRSVMRDLLRLAVDPGIISMAGGLPANDILPVETIRECMDAVLTRDGPKTLQYSPQWRPLQEWIAAHMNERGVRCSPDEIFITNGAQQGLAIISRLFLDRGEPVVLESLTFTGVQQVTSGRGAKVSSFPVDPVQGYDLDRFEAALTASPAPRLAVIIPNFHNPLGVSLPADDRQRVAALCAEHALPLIEDDPYSLLRFQGELDPPIRSFDEAGMIFYLGSFSKLLAPALRLGWIVAPADLTSTVTVLRESFDLESSTLIQRMVMEFIDRGLFPAHLERARDVYRERSAAMMNALETHLGDIARWSRPEGGIFTWVELPGSVDTTGIFTEAVQQKVAYIPGAVFSTTGGHHNTMRLSYANLTLEQIDEGLKRLSEVVRPHVT